MTRILALTRYDRNGASSRVRILQFLPLLSRQYGLEFDVKPLLSKMYLEALYGEQPIDLIEVFARYIQRLRTLINRREYDLILLEKEAFPWVHHVVDGAMMRGVPYVVDIDDAWYCRYRHHKRAAIRGLLRDKIDSVLRASAAVLAGNGVLAEYAQTCGAQRVEIIPSVIDFDRYRAAATSLGPERRTGEPVIIGWIGAPPTLPYLIGIGAALRSVLVQGRAVLHIVGAAVPKELRDLPVRSIVWNEEGEVDEVCKFDIGIMPLPNGEWERSKCGYKLLQVMAAGRPVVASPVGVNSSIVQPGINGLWAGSIGEWIGSLNRLIDDPMMRRSMGAAARRTVQERFSLTEHAPRLAEVLIEAAGGRVRASKAA